MEGSQANACCHSLKRTVYFSTREEEGKPLNDAEGMSAAATVYLGNSTVSEILPLWNRVSQLRKQL